MKLTYSQYQIFEYIPGFVCLQAPDYSIIYANKRFIELFGEPEGRHCYELIENRDKPCENCFIFGVFRTKEPQKRRWESPSGLIYMIYNNYFVDDDGRGLVLKIGMDITEEEKTREMMEELTRQQKEQIKIIDSGPAVVFLWKAKENWPVATVSSNVSRFGYDPDDFITGIVSYADIIHPDDLSRVLSEVEYNSENHIDDYTQEYRIFGKDHAEYWIEDHTLIRRDESGAITHYQGIVLDITDRKKAEDAIKRKLEFQETISAITSRFTGIYDFDDAINGTLADIGRLSRADRAYLVQLREKGTIMDNTHEWCAEGVNPQIENLRNLPSDMFPWWTEMIQSRESIHIPDVSKIPPEAKAERDILEKQNIRSILVLPVYCGDEPAGFMGFDNISETGEWTKEDFLLLNTATEIVGRILELRHMHSALTMEEEKYREFFRTSQDAVFITSIKGGLEDFNDSFVSTFGYESEEELKKVPVPMLYANPEDRKDHIGTIIKQGFTKEYPVDLRKKDGKVINTLISSVVRKDEDGYVIGFQGTIRDITEKKIAEEKLREKEERYRSTLDNMMEGCQIIGFDWQYLYLNDVAVKHARMSREDLIGKTMMEAYPGIDRTEIFAHLRECMEKRSSYKMENEFTYPDSTIGWFKLSIEPMPEGIFILTEDITESKKAEKEIKELSSFREQIIDDPVVWIAVSDGSGFVIFWNQGAERISGYNRDEAIGTYDIWNRIVPDAAEMKKMTVIIDEISRKGSAIEKLPLTIQTKSGDERNLILNLRAIADEKKGTFAIVGMGVDVTEIKKAEEKVTELSSFREQIIDDPEVWIVVSDNHGNVIIWNKAAEKITGYKSSEVTGKNNIWKKITPKTRDRKTISRKIKKIKEKGGIIEELPFPIRTKSGNERNVILSLRTLADEKKGTYAIVGMGVDITSRKVAEEALKEKTDILNERVKELTALKKISDLLITPVPEKNIFRGVIEAIVPAMQYPESTTARILFNGDEYVSEDFIESKWKIGKSLVINGEEIGRIDIYYDQEMPDADIGPFLTEEDNLLEIICHRLEMYFSKQIAEENLIAAHNRLNNIINFLPDATFVVDKQSRVIAWNNAIENMTGVSRDNILDEDEYLYSYAIYKENWPILVDYVRNPKEELPERYKNVRRGSNYISAEVDLQEVFKGKGAYVLAIASILYDENGNIDGAIESIRDISDLKRKENDLLKTLEEKNKAISEIHHRVKNNLQIISALIQMHYYKVGEEEYARLFENLNNRVLAIANVYENLIEREEFFKIYMPKLINDLVSNAMLSHPHKTDISIDTNVMDESMDLNVAVSLSMIISELLINTVKHAFLGREKGHVDVYLKREGDNGYLLEISDDGVGYHGETDLSKAETLGMRLVGILVESDLHGNIDIVVNGGTKFSIRFVL